MTLRQILANIPDQAREALLPILAKIQKKKVLAKRDVGLLGVTFEEIPHDMLTSVFGVARQTPYNWVNEGCPRNPNGTYNLREVIAWKILQVGKKGNKLAEHSELMRQKAMKDIELKDFIIKKKRSEVIETEKHAMILSARMAALKEFMENGYIANAHIFYPGTRLKPEKLRELAKAYTKEAMDAWLDGSRSIDVD